ncbi:MAG TPA: polysaccharide deacetylase family protein [Nitrosomonas sp.]|nr:polysaccharide deacetylase family protein [Nitrosomonas sp.]HNJ93078.1 polysaccharide deacetylase family protein [Nitrosomonas sp.]
MILKTLTHFCSPGGQNGKLSILIFHRVLPAGSSSLSFDINASQFTRIVQWLAKWFNVISLDQAVLQLVQGTLPPRAAAITFDDGYADNLLVATPILKNYGMSATFFIASGYLDGGQMWNDTIIESIRCCRQNHLDLTAKELGNYDLSCPQKRRKSINQILKAVKYRSSAERVYLADYISGLAKVDLKKDLMMTSEQVVLLRKAGMSIGAHTVTHPILANLSTEEVKLEILSNKRFLESLLQERIGLFAYPNGKPNLDFRFQDVQIVRSLGFDAAVTTAWGVADMQSDLMQLPRFTPWDDSSFKFGYRMLKNMLGNSKLRANQNAE